MNGNVLLSPPIVFLLLLAASWLLYLALGKLTYKSAKYVPGQQKAYASGEEPPKLQAMMNYGQFFPFAFFFTILHVVALTIATVPALTAASFVIAMLYLTGALVGLSILYRS